MWPPSGSPSGSVMFGSAVRVWPVATVPVNTGLATGGLAAIKSVFVDSTISPVFGVPVADFGITRTVSRRPWLPLFNVQVLFVLGGAQPWSESFGQYEHHWYSVPLS